MVDIRKNKLLFLPSGHTEEFGLSFHSQLPIQQHLCILERICYVHLGFLLSQNAPWNEGWYYSTHMNAHFCVHYLHVLSLPLHTLFPFCVSSGRCLRSHLDAFHCLVDGLQQGLVLRVLVAVFIGVHVSQSTHIIFKILLCDWFLLWERKLEPMMQSSLCVWICVWKCMWFIIHQYGLEFVTMSHIYWKCSVTKEQADIMISLNNK